MALILVLVLAVGALSACTAEDSGTTTAAAGGETKKADAETKAADDTAAPETEAAAAETDAPATESGELRDGELYVDPDPNNWPTVRVEVFGGSKEAEVEAALNDYLVSINAGVKADLYCLSFGERATQLTLMLTDPDNGIDLFGWRFYSTPRDMVNNEQIISLEKYKEIYPEVWQLFPAPAYEYCEVNGECYSIPGADSFSNFSVWSLRKDIAEELGVMDLADTRITIEQMEEIMAKAEAAHPDLAWQADTFLRPLMGVDNLGDDKLVGVLIPDRGINSTEIVNYYETDEWLEYIKMCKRWADAGYLVDDPLNTSINTGLLNSGVCGAIGYEAFSTQYAQSLMQAQMTNYETISMQLTDLIGDNSCVYTGWQISQVCKYPDAAMKLLALMYTDANVHNFICYGIKDETYVVDENGCAWYPEGKSNPDENGWNCGGCWWYANECLGYPFQTDYKEYFTDMQALWTDSSIKYSKAMGFVFDPTNVYDQWTACRAVVDQYRPALLFGQADVESYNEEFKAELKNAGIDEVIAEMNTQFQAWLAK